MRFEKQSGSPEEGECFPSRRKARVTEAQQSVLQGKEAAGLRRRNADTSMPCCDSCFLRAVETCYGVLIKGTE